MYLPNSLVATDDGNVALREADDVIVAMLSGTSKQRASGDHFVVPDHEAARLLAAAPDLYAALCELRLQYAANSRVYTRDLTVILDRASAAIAKAEGR